MVHSAADRVARVFVCVLLQLLSTKARITLRAKSLYAADGRAVKELLKLATLLYESVSYE